MKRNVWILSFCQAMMNSANVLLVTTSSLVGYQLAADKSLATLPLGLQFLGTMLLTIPASFLMKQLGRQPGFIIGIVIGIGGAGLTVVAVLLQSFVLFCIAMLAIGAFNGFGTYYRFAAADAANHDYRPTAISYVMAGGVIAALLGPNLANWTRGMISTTDFAGSYVGLVGLYLLSLVALLFLNIKQPPVAETHHDGRPLRTIIAQGKFIVAVIGAAVGFGIMSLVMTATPLAMHHHAHPFSDTTFVIEWHVLGMFAPSFITGHLIRRFGVLTVMLSGTLMYFGCVAINLSGTALSHFWLALLLLGIGWNFLFIGGTTLLTETYHSEEKAKVQAINDFSIFTMVTLSSLSAGFMQHYFGWRAINYGVLPLVVVIFIGIVWLWYQQRTVLRVEPVDQQNML